MRAGRRAPPAAPPPPLAPDAELVRRLADLLTETGLTEIEYATGDSRIRVARHLTVAAQSAPAASPMPMTQAHDPGGAASQLRPAADHPGAFKAPMVGIAYLAAQPGAAPFVRVGDAVAEGQTVLIIEAMKVMNQIRSPRSGRITEILIEDAEPIEYGTVLMLIE